MLEFQWCKCCGNDADRCCDVCCRCQTHRLKLFLCCGPQCDDSCECCECCLKSPYADGKVNVAECLECDCCCNWLGTRYSGCQLLCCHCSCVHCPAGCENSCCCCSEEQLRMDGDLVTIEWHKHHTAGAPEGVEMVR